MVNFFLFHFFNLYISLLLKKNLKQREASSLNGKVGYSCITCNVVPRAMTRALVWSNYQTNIEGEKLMKETKKS